MSLSKDNQHPSEIPQAMHGAIIVGWLLIIVLARSQVLALYLVPVLAALTFVLLRRFPILIGALFLSGYLDSASANRLQPPTQLLLIGLVWLAAGIVWLRQRRVITNTAHQQPDLDQPAEVLTQTQRGLLVSPSAHVRHELRTPANLIAGYCEILLGPATPVRQPLPMPYREYVEGIYRNSQQLQQLIDNIFPSSTVPQTQLSPAWQEPVPDLLDDNDRKSLIVLDEDGTASAAFKQYASRYHIVAVQSIEAIGRLDSAISPAAVLVNSHDSLLVPLIADIVGKQIPIVIFCVTAAGQLHGAQDYLMKPVQFEALAAALQKLSISLRNVLIIDDNLDNASMISHMVQSLPEHPQVWNAYSGREAIALLHERITPDVIILDFVLPDMNGLTLLDYLRSEASMAHLPVLLVSAHRPQDIAEQPGVTSMTIFRIAGIPQAGLVRYIETLIADLWEHL